MLLPCLDATVWTARPIVSLYSRQTMASNAVEPVRALMGVVQLAVTRAFLHADPAAAPAAGIEVQAIGIRFVAIAIGAFSAVVCFAVFCIHTW